MITLTETNANFNTTPKKSYICPKCGFSIDFWAYAILMCRDCGDRIPNVFSIHKFKESRATYHFTGKISGARRVS